MAYWGPRNGSYIVTPETKARLADAMREEAERLWKRMEALMKEPDVGPQDLLSLCGRTVGKLEGWSETVRWHALHD